MNLINDDFIPITRKSGKKEKIAPWQITETDDPVIALNAPRPDFNGSLMQFLIGLLQTTAMPDNFDSWLTQLETPPKPEELKKHFNKKTFAFKIEGKPAFMQDFDSLDNGKKEPIAHLLIDSPGENTLKNNTDHFVKRGRIERLCSNCTAIALFTLQNNAPMGGVGYRTSLRGGGPLTTLVILDINQWMQSDSDNLWFWRNLWLNVLDKEKFEAYFPASANKDQDKDIFPWLAETRISEEDKSNKKKQSGGKTTPQDAHPLQMYWGMPRRICIQWDSKQSGYCDLCGENSSKLIESYRTKNYGVNYETWKHTLSPYYKKTKKDKNNSGVSNEQWIAQHPREGGISYQYWLDCMEESESKLCAKVVKRYQKLADNWSEQCRLYAFGYDMENAKARCWYETTSPIFKIPDDIYRIFFKRIQDMTKASNLVAGYCDTVIKEAYFDKNDSKKKTIPFLKKQFYQHTEKDFYTLVQKLPDNLKQETDKEILHEWYKVLKQKSLNLFEYWVKKENWMDSDPKRVIKAQEKLKKMFDSKKIRGTLQLPQYSKKK